LSTISVEEAARRLRVSREEVEDWLRSGALAGEQVAGEWQIDPDSLDEARLVRETQEELVEEGYLDRAEIAETTREMREEAEEEEREEGK
jgi:excisionase family DNA binding protein